METITIHQPYANYIAEGKQKDVFKSYKTDYRGKILIHASKVDLKGEYLALPDELMKEWSNAAKDGKRFVQGAIIGSAELTECKPIDECNYQWVFSSPTLFEKPVMFVKGRAGVWDYKGELPKSKEEPKKVTTPRKPRLSSEVMEAAKRIKKTAADNVYRYLDKSLTQQEKIDLTVYPYILAGIGIDYAKRAEAECVKHRIAEMRIHKRRTDELIDKWRSDELEVIGYKNRNCIDVISRDVQEASVFTKLYFTINNVILRTMPQDEHKEMRTYAIISLLMFRLLGRHMEETSERLQPRVKKFDLGALDVPRIIFNIAEQMKKFAGDAMPFPFDDINVVNGGNIVYNELKSLEITLTK